MLGKTVILATAPPDPIRLRGGRPRWQGFFRPVWLVHGNLGVWENHSDGEVGRFSPALPRGGTHPGLHP